MLRPFGPTRGRRLKGPVGCWEVFRRRRSPARGCEAATAPATPRETATVVLGARTVGQRPQRRPQRTRQLRRSQGLELLADAVLGAVGNAGVAETSAADGKVFPSGVAAGADGGGRPE